MLYEIIGRLESPLATIASSSFKINDYHALIIPKVHSALGIDKDVITEVFDLAIKWMNKVQDLSPSHMYPVLIYDQLLHTAASQIHPQFHLIASDAHYLGPYHMIANSAESYKGGIKGFFQDYIAGHAQIGLTFSVGKNTVVMSPLDAFKDHELVVISEAVDQEFIDAVDLVIKTYQNELNIFCFTSVYVLPVMEEDKDTQNLNSLPVIVKFGSQGNCQSLCSGTISLELYGMYNINTDPYTTISAFKDAFFKSNTETGIYEETEDKKETTESFTSEMPATSDWSL